LILCQYASSTRTVTLWFNSEKSFTPMYILYTAYGTPGRVRTCDLRLRSPLLYPAELPGHVNIITDENKLFFTFCFLGFAYFT
jgi:hypothetical protein